MFSGEFWVMHTCVDVAACIEDNCALSAWCPARELTQNAQIHGSGFHKIEPGLPVEYNAETGN